MTVPVTPWSEYARSEWARIDPDSLEAVMAEREASAIREAAWNARLADALRAPETDDEAWDLLEGSVVVTAWWAIAVAVVGGALAAVLAVLGLRKAARRA